MRQAAIFLSIIGTVALGPLPAAAGPAAPAMQVSVSGMSSQARRPGTRLRVTPGRRLLYRDCTFRLAQERRPGGTYIVPRQRCWWVRG